MASADARRASTRGVVLLLTAQAVAFGMTLAMLLVSGNALFLDAYGSSWLPATYVAIAVVGILTSAVVAKAVRRFPLVVVAAVVLAAFAVVFAGSWLVLVAGGRWISALLLVSFPILIQIGFVFIGGQAGRMLDLREIKVLFPRIVSGFAVGFLVGGLVGIPLLSLLGSTRNLVLATTFFDLVFLGLLLLTWRRHPAALAKRDTAKRENEPRPPLRRLLGHPFVLLVLGYQILSAMGTQAVDFLFFDRAAHRYAGEDLTRFLAQYTAVLNLIDIAFLALLAGFLLQRLGLRFGLAANPLGVTLLVSAMLVPLSIAGGGSLGLFTLAALARITDLSLTDGTTRTSMNAAYQVLPVDGRLTVQASVEGIGVPAAIGVTGVVLLLLQLLPGSLGLVIVFTLLLCVGWSAVAFALARAYRRSLADNLQQRLLGDRNVDLADETEAAALRELLTSDDGNDVRLGLDLVAGLESPAVTAELERLAGDSRSPVRLAALARLVSLDAGAGAGRRLADEVAAAASSTDPADRRAAASTFAALGGDRCLLGRLLADDDAGVRTTALESVGSDDAAFVELTVAALGDARTAAAARRAIGRLGPSAASAVIARLADGSTPTATALRLLRVCRAVADAGARQVLVERVDDPDRVVGLAALDALRDADVDEPLTATLDRVLHDGADHALRAFAAMRSLGLGPDDPLRRALVDEVDLARRRIAAALAVGHGAETTAALRALDSPDRGRRALALESLEIVLTRSVAQLTLPVLQPDLDDEARSAALSRVVTAPDRDARGWLDDLVADRDGKWRSPWVRRCASAKVASLREVEPH